MEAAAGLLPLLSGPAAGALLAWYLVAKVMPRRDEVYAQSIRDAAQSQERAMERLGERIDRLGQRIDRLTEAVLLSECIPKDGIAERPEKVA